MHAFCLALRTLRATPLLLALGLPPLLARAAEDPADGLAALHQLPSSGRAHRALEQRLTVGVHAQPVAPAAPVGALLAQRRVKVPGEAGEP
mgnify:CR=1 FL=1